MKKEETFYEPFEPLESDGNESIFLNPEKTLKITVTDGDRILREGIDYRTVYVRGHGNVQMSWLMVARGKGKYEKMFLRAYVYNAPPELIPPERRENCDAILDIYHLAQTENDGSTRSVVFDSKGRALRCFWRAKRQKIAAIF